MSVDHPPFVFKRGIVGNVPAALSNPLSIAIRKSWEMWGTTQGRQSEQETLASEKVMLETNQTVNHGEPE